MELFIVFGLPFCVIFFIVLLVVGCCGTSTSDGGYYVPDNSSDDVDDRDMDGDMFGGSSGNRGYDFFNSNSYSGSQFDRDLDNGEYDDDPDILREEDPETYSEFYE